LMEMMEANEKIAELEFKPDDRVFADISNLLADKEKELRKSVLPSFSDFDGSPEKRAVLKNVKDYFLKTRYLLRIRENLLKFAPD
jgi:molecular chaperone HscB